MAIESTDFQRRPLDDRQMRRIGGAEFQCLTADESAGAVKIFA